MNDDVVDLKTPDELDSEPYPANVRLACRYFEHEDDFNDRDDELLWITSDERFIEELGEGSFWPCSVLDRISDGPKGIYSVEIFQSQSVPDTKWTKLGIRRIIERFPRQSIAFLPLSGSTDHYLTGVFRHAIGLPRDMLVEQWMVN